MRKFITLFLITLFCVSNVNAQLSKAKDLYSKGKYEEALPLFKKEYKKNNKNKKNGSINHWIGVCLYELGREEESIEYFEFATTKRVIESPRYLAMIYSKNYKFDDAIRMYNEYQSIMEDNDKEIDEAVKEDIRYAKLAKSMLDHVEDIVVLDSITVDKEKFFEHYKLSPETGYIVPQSELPINIEQSTIGFKDQSSTRLLWSMPDENGKMRLCETVKLIDGNWDTPKFIDEQIESNGDLICPFLMQDGMTLYYSSNDENTLGGYDIYFTRKDEDSGEFLKGRNIGMPYNSESNDYMMVLDDVTGYGWWATERNNIEGKVTIYVFKRNEIRKNHRLDEINLPSLAQLSNYKLTWGDEDYQSVVYEIRNMDISTVEHRREVDFMFVIKKGLVYDSFIDFKSKDAAQEMKQLLSMYKERDLLKSKLSNSRIMYAKSNSKNDIVNDILQLEKELNKLNEIIFKTENWVRKEEQRLLN